MENDKKEKSNQRYKTFSCCMYFEEIFIDNYSKCKKKKIKIVLKGKLLHAVENQ